MRKFALATAAVLLTTGAAFAQASIVPVAPQYNDAGQLPGSEARGPAVTIPGAVPVAPQYDDAGRLPTDVRSSGGSSSAAYGITPTVPVFEPNTIAVAPQYDDSGKLPTDR